MIVIKHLVLSIILYILFYQSSTQNTSCPILCSSCTSSGLCQQCFINFQSTSLTTPITSNVNNKCSCPQGFYNAINPLTGISYCYFCPVECKTCNGYSQCTSCLQGYTLISEKCIYKKNYNYDTGDWISYPIRIDLTEQKLKNQQAYGLFTKDAQQIPGTTDFLTCQPLGLQMFWKSNKILKYNSQVFRSYFNLPFHEWIQIKFQYAIIDQWHEDSINLYLNKNNSYVLDSMQSSSEAKIKTYNNSLRLKNLCLNESLNDSLGVMAAQFQHNNSMAKIKITSSFYNQIVLNNLPVYYSQAFYGLRQIFIRVGTCQRHCLTCSSYDYCLSCKQLYKLVNGNCVCDLDISFPTSYGCHKNCSQGFFKLDNGDRCLLCQLFQPGCQICDTYNKCSLCNKGYYLFNKTNCRKQCPSIGYQHGYTDLNNDTINDGICIQCTNGCLSCSNRFCLNCQDKYYKKNGQCVQSCQDGLYPHTFTKNCISCHFSCSKCISQYFCTQCKTGLSSGVQYFLVAGVCLQKCQGFNYTGLTQQKIEQMTFFQFFLYFDCSNITCDISCSYCFGSNNTNCLNCPTDQLLTPKYQCVSDCPTGYFQQENKCLQCPFFCPNCSTNDGCLQCISGYFLFQGKCVLICPPSTYPDSKLCKSCDVNCALCTNTQYCILCQFGYRLYNGMCSSNFTCLPAKYYDIRIASCANCPQNCDQCYRTLCYTCSSGFYLDNGVCVVSCSAQKIKTSNDKCQWKSPLCQVYDSGQDPVCVKCVYLEQPLVLENNICKAQCSQGNGVNLSTLLCNNCSLSNCLRCDANINKCYRCFNGYTLSNDGTCVSNCSSGYINDGIQCIKCPIGCLKCQTDGSCQSCQGTYVLNSQIKRCVNSECQNQSNYYYNPISTSCQQCISPCKTCLSSSSCTSCINGLVLNQNTCLTVCPSGKFYDEAIGMCLPCKPQCPTCSKYGNCTSCIQHTFYWNGACQRICPAGTYPSKQTHKCQKCAQNCMQCYGEKQFQCLKCFENFKMDHTTCVSECPLKKYSDNTDHCDWCHQLCQKCWGPAQFQCEYCSYGNYLYNGYCDDACPAATYPLAQNNRVCFECQWGCAICTSSNNCQLCFGGFYLHNGICNRQCPYLYYFDYQNRICKNCSIGNCSKCNQAGCVRCQFPYYRWNKTCVSTCPSGTYHVDHNLRQCLHCPTHCDNCTSPTMCNTCKIGYRKNKYGFCTDKCMIGFYRYLVQYNETIWNQNTQSNQTIQSYYVNCKPCYSQCFTCNGNINCTQCNANKPYLIPNGTCTNNCPSQYFLDLSNKLCVKCPPKCNKCIDYNKCTQCIGEYQLINGLCTKNSSSCQSNCANCPDLNSCYFCQIPYYLYQYQCVLQCPQGYFQTGRDCKHCNPLCSSCQYLSYNCTSCQSGLYLVGNQCWENCPVGYFANSQNICKKCGNQHCIYCLNSTQCQLCQNGFAIINGTCQKDCPASSFYSSDLGICISCQQDCLNCLSNGDCIQCVPGMSLLLGNCTQNCPDDHYLSYIQNRQDGSIYTVKTQCKPCKFPCLKCEGYSQHCTGCFEGYQLDNNKCIKNCSIGYYSNNATNACQACSPQCRTCIINATKCITCAQGLLLYKGNCQSSCPIGYYGYASKCIQCPNSCIQCFGAENNFTNSNGTQIILFEVKCVKCKNSTVLYDQKCLSYCPAGTYNSSYQCLPCNSPCKTCSGSSIYECFSCKQGFFYRNGRCLDQCPVGTYADIITQSCKPCRAGCLICFSRDKCSQCKTGLVAIDGICNNSNPCSLSNCQYCQTSTSTASNATCLSCKDGFYLNSFGYCVQQCPSSYYGINQICRPCLDANCSKCLPQNPNYCTQCVNGSWLYLGNCYQECPQGSIQDWEAYYNSWNTTFNQTNNSYSNAVNQCKSDPCSQYLIISWYQYYQNEAYYNTIWNISNTQTDNNTIKICINCNQPYYLLNNNCVLSCDQIGYYQSQGSCLPCSQGCNICLSDIQCQQCKQNYHLYQGKCLKNCPAGSFSSYLYNQTCVSCEKGCLRCQNKCNNNDCPICQECATGLYFNPVTKKCLTYCQTGYYLNTVYDNCLNCSSQCITCLNKTYCTSCKLGYSFFNGKCILNCTTGTFKIINIDNTTTCQPCSLNCQNCTSKQNCTTCLPGKVLQNQRCISQCAPGYLLLNGYCQKCLSPCKTCTNILSYCMSCQQGSVLQNGNCTKLCINGTYKNSNGQCNPCAPSCQTCSSYDYCTSCFNGYVIDSSGNCYQNCTSATSYYDSYNHICKSCSQDCFTCFGPFFDNCLSCNLPLVLYNKTCISSCPSGFFNQGYICKACDIIKCKTCSSKQNFCKSCYIGYVLDPITGICSADCPLGKFKNVNGVCQFCDSSCATCYGNGANQCFSCTPPKILSHNGNCINSCDPPTMRLVNNVCQQCPINCLYCDTLSCTTCKTGYKLNLQSQCVPLCPITTYSVKTNTQVNGVNITSQSCQSCGLNCAYCQSSNICTTCLYPKVLNGSQCIDNCSSRFQNINGVCKQQICQGYYYRATTASVQQCVALCPSGFYPDVNNVCKPCQQGCSQCQAGNGCTSCQHPYIYFASQNACILQCPFGYIKILIQSQTSNSTNITTTFFSSYICVQCTSPCLTCQNNPQKCTGCIIGKVLIGDSCVNSCPIGYYLNSTDSKCYKCLTQCYKCINSIGCTQCINLAYSLPYCNQTTSCNGSNYLDILNNCKPCHFSCAKCFGPSYDQCLSCNSSKKLSSGQCLDNCTNGYYYNLAKNQCEICQLSCLACGNIGYCFSCKAGYILYNNKCLSDCESLNTAAAKYVKNIISNQCVACPINCLSCVYQSGSTVCLNCISPYYLSNNSCIINCSSGYFSVETTSGNKICQLCKYPCLTCSELADKCLSCSNNTYLQNNKCESGCPPTYFINTTSKQCVKCSPTNCIACFNTPFYCSSCKQPYSLNSTTGQCSSCLTGFFMTNSGICSPCDVICSKCQTFSNKCISCPSGSILFNNTCIFQCPTGYTLNYQAQTCTQCALNCKTCSSSGTNQCTQCNSGYLLSQTKTCNTTCPLKQYPKQNLCYNCPAYCSACSSGTECISCQLGYAIINGVCTQNCPQGTTLVGNTCQNCKQGCKACTNGLTDCSACQQNYIRQTDGSCIPKPNICPDGQYLNDFNLCVDCHFSCLKCVSSTKCTQCKSGATLNQGNCIANCPDGQYLDSITNLCKNCLSQCKTCTGSTSTNCTSCPSGKILRNDGSCQTSCPTKTYLYNQNCVNCPTLCEVCTSSTKCSTCSAGVPIFYNDLCYNNCPDGSFAVAGSCTACPSQCLTCVSLNNCTSCNYPKRFYQFKCIDSCPKGTYPAINSNTCQNCLTQCQTCLSLTTCTSCILNKYLSNGSCVSNCPVGQFPNSAKICTNCTPPCKQCSILSNNCTQCIQGYALLPNKTCSNQCPVGQYMSVNTTCQNCIVNNCKICQDTPTCFECKANYSLYNNDSQCVNPCPNTYFNNSTNNNRCQLCQANCKHCNSSQNCTQCLSPKILYQQNCVNSCPIGTYTTKNNSIDICIDCVSHCDYCDLNGTCTKCSQNYFYLQQKCLPDCPDTYFKAYLSSTCQQCSPHCKTCTDNNTCQECINQNYVLINNQCVHKNCINCNNCSNEVCVDCYAPYFLENESCVQNCTDGSYGNSTLKKCEPCIQNCILCPSYNVCSQCITNFVFTTQSGCIDQAYLQFGDFSNMSGFTSNITQITSSVYLATAVGPTAFGEMSATYSILEFNQILYAFKNQCKGNKEMSHFLNSLRNMALSAAGDTSSQTNSTSTARRLQTSDGIEILSSQPSFLQANMFTFILIGVFIVVYISVLIIQKSLPYCMDNCPKLHFYTNQICQFIQKRFKWIYFDFIMWISYIPFIFFALQQFKNFSFTTAELAISCLFSIAVIATYPLYPFLICYIIKSNYTDLCLGTNTMTEMSLSPYVYKVNRPLQVPEQGQFRYFTKDNFRFIYYPLCYVRKFVFMILIVFIPSPAVTLGVLAGIQIAFLGYIIALKPRKMPHLVADIIIEVVLLLMILFIMIFLLIDSTRVTVMSIVTQAIGFITANISIIIGIILNLIAYYKIFMCVYDLIKHMREKINQKQKLQKVEEGSDPNQIQDDSNNNLINDKQLPSGIKKEKNDDSLTQNQVDQNNHDIYNMLNDKQLLFNGIDPLRVSKGKQTNNFDELNDLPDMRLSSSGIHKDRSQNRNKRRSKIQQKKVNDSPDKNSDDALGSSLQSDGILIKQFTGTKFKRNIAGQTKDHLLLQQGVIKDVTKDKYKRGNLSKIPSRHDQQEIDELDDLNIIQKNKNINNGKKNNNNQVPEGNIKQLNANPKKLKDDLDTINDGNLIDKNKNSKSQRNIEQIPVIQKKNKKNKSIKEQQKDLDQLIGIDRQNNKKLNTNKQIQQLRFYDVPQKNKKPSDNNNQKQLNQGKFLDKDSKYKQDQTINNMNQQPNKNQKNKLKEGLMKERQGEAFDQFNQLLESNKGKIPSGKMKDKSKKLVNLQQEENDNQIEEGKFKDRKENYKSNNKPSNNFFEDNDKDNNYQNQGKMVDRDKKRKNNASNMTFQQDSNLGQIKTYEKTANKYKRNVGNQNQSRSDRNIDAQTYDINTKKAQTKPKNTNNENQLQQGKFVDRQNTGRTKLQKNSLFDQTDDHMKIAKTTQLRTKKNVKQQKKGFFQNIFNKDPEESIKIQSLQQKNKSHQFEEFQQSEMGHKNRRSKRHSKKQKDTYLRHQEDVQQSYDQIIKRNKQNIILPQNKKGKGVLNIQQDNDFEDSSYQKSPKRLERQNSKRQKDRGLNINDRSSQSQGQDTLIGPRKQRSSSIQRQRKMVSRLHINNNDDSSDFDESISPQTRRKKQQQKAKRKNKSGILQISTKNDGDDDDLDNIQL